MRKSLLSIALFILAITTLSSCLGETTEYTYYDDAAIASFKLGTLNRYFHKTKSDGTDSVYKRTLSCSDYVFYIDQENREIWNPDSLPVEIDPSAVVCTITTKNSGTVTIKSLTSDSLKTYSSSDSIDFSEPRQFYVYNNSGTAGRMYTIRVNVHQEYGDSCTWTEVVSSNSQLAALTNMKALNLGDNMYLFGNEGTTPKLYVSAISDGQNWQQLSTSPALTTDAYKNVLVKDGAFFLLDNGNILKSTDAQTWTVVAPSANRQLIAATSKHLYALTAEGKLVSSSDDGATWTEEALDADASFLPYDNISYACHTLRTNADADKVVLIGNRSLADYPDETTAVVWSKVDEYSDGARNNSWNYVEFASDNRYKAPRAENWQLVNYDESNIKAICGNGVGSNSTEALSQIYQSGDDGITWLSDSIMTVPSDLSSSATSFTMATDSSNYVWIICGGTGQVWKVRINRLAWKKEQDYFFE